ncbi:9820_t:CDS:2 [Ambispora leptoticha]|uniref:9820_t:CDS:1 n=1 Tax=Ambispora leptoticha TaxID=144679 RepID=A0A9N9D7L7_9GLOM|nr:9820_t:CDS:2 [Ambispora leptoticha]
MTEKTPEVGFGTTATTTATTVTPLTSPALEAAAENGSEIHHVSKRQAKNSSKMETIITSSPSISTATAAPVVVKKEVVITTDEVDVEIDHLTIPVNNNGRKNSPSSASIGSPDSDAKAIGVPSSPSSSSSASNSSRSSSPTTMVKEIATTAIINPPKRGRGRPRKGDTNESDNHSQSTLKPPTTTFDANDDSNDDSSTRKRGLPSKDSTPFAQFAAAATDGRPPKNSGIASDTANNNKTATAKLSSSAVNPKKRGRPPKGTATSNTSERKRGRPRKEEMVTRNRERKSLYNLNPDGWTVEEDRTLVDSVLESLAVPPWAEIAKRVQNHDAAKCFNRWTALKRRLYREEDG